MYPKSSETWEQFCFYMVNILFTLKCEENVNHSLMSIKIIPTFSDVLLFSFEIHSVLIG